VPRKPRNDYPGGTYHVFTRGNDGRRVYRTDYDRYGFLELLRAVVSRYTWVVYAYCLMTNHYHALVRVPEGGLSGGMCQLNGRFARWSNWRGGRQDHVFGKRYGCTEIIHDAHLLETCRYIVLNPVRAGLVAHPREWYWSSYAACAGDDYPHPALALDELLRLFGTTPVEAMAAYRRFVDAGLDQLVPGTISEM
jgi:putative transposase